MNNAYPSFSVAMSSRGEAPIKKPAPKANTPATAAAATGTAVPPSGFPSGPAASSSSSSGAAASVPAPPSQTANEILPLGPFPTSVDQVTPNSLRDYMGFSRSKGETNPQWRCPEDGKKDFHLCRLLRHVERAHVMGGAPERQPIWRKMVEIERARQDSRKQKKRRAEAANDDAAAAADGSKRHKPTARAKSISLDHVLIQARSNLESLHHDTGLLQQPVYNEVIRVLAAKFFDLGKLVGENGLLINGADVVDLKFKQPTMQQPPPGPPLAPLMQPMSQPHRHVQKKGVPSGMGLDRLS